MQGPLAPDAVRPDRVYQRLIDSFEAPGVVVFIRVGIVGPAIVWVELRRRPLEARFVVGRGLRWTRHHAAEVLSADEQARILAACAGMRLDFGELDLLRDDRDGRLYLLDVNKTASCLAPSSCSRGRMLIDLAELTGTALLELARDRRAATRSVQEL